jgi:RNA polymerase sigma-70 factor (ECF subfamily)
MIYLVFNEGYSQADPKAEACAFATRRSGLGG